MTMENTDLERIHQKCCEKNIFIKNREGDSITVPITLNPSVYNEKLFERAMNSMVEFNLLVDKLSENLEFLELIQQELEGSDGFMERLFKLHKESIQSPYNGKIVAGLSRNDFLVSAEKLYQVELNTLSCSFMALSQKVSEAFQETYPEKKIPENHSLDESAELINEVHRLYIEEYYLNGDSQSLPPIAVLVLVQENERNYWDQQHLLNRVKDKRISILKKSFKEINGKIEMNAENGKLELDGIEFSCVYFRTGYSPHDYLPQEEECWESRILIEKSRTIKIPNVSYQLIGKKIVQRLLKNSTVFEKFAGNQFQNIPQYFAGLWSCKDEKAIQLAIQNPENFVLKPQRDGGGNNLYGKDIVDTLKNPSINKSAYVLMEYIRSPSVFNSLVKFKSLKNSDNQDDSIERNIDVVCELGVYGGFLKCNGQVKVNKELGYLLRTKSQESKESGIMAGYGFLDSPEFEIKD